MKITVERILDGDNRHQLTVVGAEVSNDFVVETAASLVIALARGMMAAMPPGMGQDKQTVYPVVVQTILDVISQRVRTLDECTATVLLRDHDEDHH